MNTEEDMQLIYRRGSLADLHHTVLEKFAVRSMLHARFNDAQASNMNDDLLMAQLANILRGDLRKRSRVGQQLTVQQEWEFLRSSAVLDDHEYATLLAFVQHRFGPRWVSPRFDLQDNQLVLPPRAVRHKQLTFDGDRTFSCRSSHLGNSSIHFYGDANTVDSTRGTFAGCIEGIWEMPVHAQLQVFFLVRLHKDLSPEEDARTPFGDYPLLQSWAVDAEPSATVMMIHISDVISHVAMYERPAGTFNIPRPVIVLCRALDRGRHL